MGTRMVRAEKRSGRFVILNLLTLLLIFVLTVGSAYAGPTERVSVSSDGAEGNGGSAYGSISADGRYVAFRSDASSLVPGDTNGRRDIFVHDRTTGETTRISVSSDGIQGNSDAMDAPDISADGRYVVFCSGASNLVSGDTNSTYDIFVHDRSTGVTSRVNVSSSGQEANSSSRTPAVSADGRYVAFSSGASNLTPEGLGGIFVRDRVTGETTLVSVNSAGQAGNGGGMAPDITPDGRFVVFISSATNLVTGDTNGANDVFVHDRQTGETARASVNSAGQEGNSYCTAPVISADGRYVAFASAADNLIDHDTNGNADDVFVHDRTNGETVVVSVETAGLQSNWLSESPSISADGTFVSFWSSGSNLSPEDSNGADGDIFIHNLTTGETTLASVDSSGINGESESAWGKITPDGRYVVFNSYSANFVSGDTNGVSDVFVHDRAATPGGETGGGGGETGPALSGSTEAAGGGGCFVSTALGGEK